MISRREQDRVGLSRITTDPQYLGELLEGLRVVGRFIPILFREPLEQPYVIPASHGAVLGCTQSTQAIVGEPSEVAGSLFLRNGASFKDVGLTSAVIGLHLQLRDSDFDGHLNLSNASIGDELHLNSPRPESKNQKPGDENFPPPRWTETSRLTLRNARVGALNDTKDAWPGRLDLTGFTYARLGGVLSTEDSAMSARSNEWLLNWLAKQVGYESTYNPQPFEQLASAFPG